ncbi:MAG: dihydrofolate reductase [Methylococcales bacterium]
MKISLIVAMAENRAIGLNNQMPWHLSADLKRFKQITMGAPILMGRNTFESIGRPLPGRTNIIISTNPHYQQSGCLLANSIEQALTIAGDLAEQVFIIGGATLYEATLSRADLIYLTQIHQDFPGDTFFPEIDTNQWLEIDREDINSDDSVAFRYSFIKLMRIN